MQTPARFYRWLMKPKNWMWRLAIIAIGVALLPVFVSCVVGG